LDNETPAVAGDGPHFGHLCCSWPIGKVIWQENTESEHSAAQSCKKMLNI